MDEILGVLMCPRAELLDLVQDKATTFGLVANLIILVYNDEQVSLLVARGEQELLGGQGEVVFCRYDEDDNVDLLLAGEDGGCLDAVAVQTRRIDKGDVDDAVAKQW